MVTDVLAQAVAEAMAKLGVEITAGDVQLERPARAEHGDWSSNVALATAKLSKRKPRDVADDLAAALNANPPPHVTAVEVAGPGFVNFRLAPTWLHDVLTEVVGAGTDAYARLDIGTGTTVNVEFVSANPTGPLHVGHGRGAAYGDSLGRVMARAGYKVQSENYLNDRGSQMANFAASLTARSAGADLPEDGYAGQYVIDWAAEMPADVDPAEWGRTRAIESHRSTLEAFGVTFDTWFSERSMIASGAIDETLADLKERDVVYEADGATWLRSTDFGDDKDRVLVRSNGEFTYLLPDIAYHRDKLARCDIAIDVWGADHHGYVPRMKAALAALGHEPAETEMAIVQLAHLLRGGETVKLSKRTGEIIELAELLDEVGPDAARLTYLLQSIDSTQTFDIDVVTSQANENPVFYVQYAHARIHSMSAKAAERGVVRGPLADADLSTLSHERELTLLRLLSELPQVVAISSTDRAPHKVATWVRELASAFHGFYHDCRVLGDDVDPALTQARLWLIEGSRIGFSIGLDLLGVSAPESM